LKKREKSVSIKCCVYDKRRREERKVGLDVREEMWIFAGFFEESTDLFEIVML
jgi:hypothetical protein